MNARCMSCGKSRESFEKLCKECGSPIEIVPEGKYNAVMKKNFKYIERWISLGESETPLLRGTNLSFKFDYFQPTFSYKDRGSRVAISALTDVLRERGINEINEDSSGNAGCSIAAYGRAAGFKVNIFVPGNANEAKIRQIKAYGANIVEVEGGRETVAEEAMKHEGFHMSHVLVPEFRDGIRSLAYEIFEQYDGELPDRIFIPISAGTLFLGLHAGLNHLLQADQINKIPEIVCVQPDLISPICSALGETRWVDQGLHSIADALVTKNSPLMTHVISRLKKTGFCLTVSEEEIIEARNSLALKGILTEYSSATVYAAYRKKEFDGENLLILSGNGLKTL